MACHHGDYDPQTVEAVLVTAADALSAARPGARREVLETYVKRLEKLEEIANSFKGVQKSFAIQAGREVRIIVDSGKIGDEQAIWLSKDIAKQDRGRAHLPRPDQGHGDPRDARRRVRAMNGLLFVGDVIGKPGRQAVATPAAEAGRRAPRRLRRRQRREHGRRLRRHSRDARRARRAADPLPDHRQPRLGQEGGRRAARRASRGCCARPTTPRAIPASACTSARPRRAFRWRRSISRARSS